MRARVCMCKILCSSAQIGVKAWHYHIVDSPKKAPFEHRHKKNTTFPICHPDTVNITFSDSPARRKRPLFQRQQEVIGSQSYYDHRTDGGVKIMLKQKKRHVQFLPESVPLCFTAVDIEVCFLFNLESVEPYLL